jgi:hypothetical protein
MSEHALNGGPFSGSKFIVASPNNRFPRKLFLHYLGYRVAENASEGEMVTVGADGLIAEYDFDEYETGEFHFVQWTRNIPAATDSSGDK